MRSNPCTADGGVFGFEHLDELEDELALWRAVLASRAVAHRLARFEQRSLQTHLGASDAFAAHVEARHVCDGDAAVSELNVADVGAAVTCGRTAHDDAGQQIAQPQ